MKKWNRKLGTSKKEQGIVTLKMPVFKKPEYWMMRIEHSKFMNRAIERMPVYLQELFAITKLTKAEKLKLLTDKYDKKGK